MCLSLFLLLSSASLSRPRPAPLLHRVLVPVQRLRRTKLWPDYRALSKIEKQPARSEWHLGVTEDRRLHLELRRLRCERGQTCRGLTSSMTSNCDCNDGRTVGPMIRRANPVEITQNSKLLHALAAPYRVVCLLVMGFLRSRFGLFSSRNGIVVFDSLHNF